MKKTRLAGLLLAAVTTAVGLAAGGVANAAQPARPIPFSAPGGYFELINDGTLRCADVTGASTASGARVQEFGCLNQDNQLWKLDPQANGSYKLQNKHSFQCLDWTPGMGRNGNQLTQQPCLNESTTQQWQVNVVATFPQTIFQLRNVVTGRCMDLNDDSSADHTPIQLWDCFGIPAQMWLFG
jgi:hypothetical protein